MFKGMMTVPEFTAMISLFLTLSSPVRMLAGFFRTAVTNAGSAQRVDEFIQATSAAAASTEADEVNLERPLSEDMQESTAALASITDTGDCELRLQDVCFRSK